MTRYYFIHQTGCEACEEQQPIVDAFCAAHPELKRVDVDLAIEEWKARGWTPQATPTHVILRPGKKPNVYEGTATLEELEEWLEATR